MATLAPIQGQLLQQVLDDTWPTWGHGLNPRAYAQLYAAQLATAFGRSRLERWGLVDGPDVVASAKVYTFDATLAGRSIAVAGLGAVFTPERHRRRGAARELIDRLLARAADAGAALAMLFSEIGPDYYARLGFDVVPMPDRQLRIAESPRHGAPATLVRSGDARDLPAMVAMNATRAEAFRFHLNRDADLIQYATTRARLTAALGPAGMRSLEFFVTEEGHAAAAYVVLSTAGDAWRIEECGDRDPSGARVGAILQSLVAREPSRKRPLLMAWLPEGFCPPQVTIEKTTPAAEVMMVRALNDATRALLPFASEDVCYWHGDAF